MGGLGFFQFILSKAKRLCSARKVLYRDLILWIALVDDVRIARILGGRCVERGC
ncbi:Unknown protein sequence [Pseudomonas amygdali pv. lachrymans]|nr:Unknown protein sequence [Pseudomonas amygdali pv. lachrymans]